MENHHFQCETSLYKWPFSIAMLNYQRVTNQPGYFKGLTGTILLATDARLPHQGSLIDCILTVESEVGRTETT